MAAATNNANIAQAAPNSAAQPPPYGHPLLSTTAVKSYRVSPPDDDARCHGQRAWRYVLTAALSVVPLALGLGVGAQFDGEDGREGYGGLRTPSYAPPPVAFAIIWPILYVLIGAAVFVATYGPAYDTAYAAVFLLYLVAIVNVLVGLAHPYSMRVLKDARAAYAAVWATTFASLTLAAGAVYVALMLGGSTARALTALVLLVPYVIWTAFASALSTDVLVLNFARRSGDYAQQRPAPSEDDDTGCDLSYEEERPACVRRRRCSGRSSSPVW